MSFKCPDCVKEYEGLTSLSLHYRGTHKKTSKDLYVNLKCGGVLPTCACGCGGEVKFLDITRGFSSFVPGHQSRVKNNFQTEKSKANSLKTRRKMLEEGTWKPFHSNETGKPWNLGLTKEDPRIARGLESRDTEEYRKVSSERMREARLSGKIPTLRGENHSQWKGGTSPLLAVCHANKKLFEKWKYPLLVASNFTCSNCGKQNKVGQRTELHVHHDEKQMSEIVREIASAEGWNEAFALSTNSDPEIFSLKQIISEKVAQYHIDNQISGIVLCKACHSDLHDKLNF